MELLDVPIWPGSSSFFPGSTPFGFYDNDYDFQIDSDLLELLNNNNFYGFITINKMSIPMLIDEKDGSSNNSDLEIYVNEEILIYIDNISNYELLKSIKKFNNCLSENNIIFDKYYIGGIVNKNII